jgi:arylsulfatase A-like enzyme
MKRRAFLKHSSMAGAAAAATLGAGRLTGAANAGRPNVIVILTDDQGLGDFSFTGNPVLKTPHVDALAARSVRFTDFHVTPVCTPTRGQLLTGCDALHNLASAVTAGRTVVRRDMPMMGDLFRRSGYATGLFGKWHLGHDYPDRPMDRGFDKAVWFKGWGLQSEIEFDNDYVNPRYLDGLEEKRASKYCTDLWFDEAMGWMQKQTAAKRPFFAYIPTNAPHLPMWPPASHADLYAGKVEPNAAAFFAMIANIDDNLGRLEQWLKQGGQLDNTILVFLTDNGGTVGRTVYNAGLRDFKSSHYEGGHRVPCLLRWPGGGFDQGFDVSTPTQVQDLLPTLLDLCGVSAGTARFDGRSLAPLARRQPFPDRTLVVQFGLRERAVKYEASVIWKQWRLQKGTELYDMEADRGEKNNVAAAHPDIVAKMKADYDAWWARREPELDTIVPQVIGAKEQNPVMITSIDWWQVDCDNINFVSNGTGGPRGGVWNVDVRRSGRYHVELRRWPFHTNMALGSEGPRSTVNGRALTQPVKRMPAYSVVLAADGAEQSTAVTPESIGASFEIELKQGRHRLQGWLRDRDGQDLCGAYYALFTLKT